MQRNLYLCLLADISPEEDISPKNKLRNTFFSKCVTTLFTRAIVTQLFRLDVLYVRWCWYCNSIPQNIWTSKNLVRPRNIPSNQLRNRELCWKQKIKPLLGCGFVLMISVSRLDKAWKWGHIFIEIYKDCIDIHTFLVLQEKKMEKDKTWNVDFSGEQTLPAHINASNRSGVNVSTLTPPPPLEKLSYSLNFLTEHKNKIFACDTSKGLLPNGTFIYDDHCRGYETWGKYISQSVKIVYFIYILTTNAKIWIFPVSKSYQHILMHRTAVALTYQIHPLPTLEKLS